MALVPQLGEPGSFWRGADGQVYVAGQDGTNAAGDWNTDTFNYWNDRKYRLINDPTGQFDPLSGGNPTGTAPTGPYGTGTGTGTEFKDTTKQRESALAALSALDTVQTNRLSQEEQSYNDLIARYQAEKLKEQGRYTDQVGENERALSSGSQAAMLAAAQGGRGLRATLAAMGALGGTGSVLADRAITDSANKDLGGAQENFKTNAKTLQTAWGDFEDQDKERRKTAENTKISNRQAVEGDILTERQKLLQDMAGYWEDAGNTSKYGKYMSDATRLTPQIASKSKSKTSYTPAKASFSPAELSNYLAGNRDMTVGRQAGAQGGATALNNPLYAFSQSSQKDEELV